MIAAFLVSALPPIAGSAVTAILVGSIIWAIISLALGRFEFRMTPLDRWLAWTFTAFVAAILFTGLLGDDRQDLLRSSLWLTTFFLGPWAVLSRLRASPNLDYLRIYVTGAAVGCIGALVIALIQSVVFPDERPAGGAGNAAVFAMMCLCLTGFAALGISSRNRQARLLACAGTVSGVLAIILSGTRGVAMILPAVFVLVALYSKGNWRPLARRSTLAGLVVASAIVLYATADLIALRIDETMQEIDSLMATGYSSSIGERLRLWHAAWLAFNDSPLWGHGIQNRMDAVLQHLTAYGPQDVFYSHPHNAFLAFALDGGLIVFTALLALLAVPVVIAWRAPRDDGNYRLRLFLALLLVLCYTLTGMTQIMFKHDIMDSFFILTALYLSASIPAGVSKRTP